MAIKTFGYTGTRNQTHWGGSGNYSCVGLRTTMPETGTILSMRMAVERYSGALPNIWGMIWARTGGQILSQSPSSVRPSTTFTTWDTMAVTTFPMQNNKINGGTPIWVGLFKDSVGSGKGAWFGGRNSSGYATDYRHSQHSSPTTFATTGTIASGFGLWVEVTYKTGGEVKVFTAGSWQARPAKVWTGSAWVEKPVKIWNGSSWVESES